MPVVTAVMATYNWSSVLPYSIGSVLDQTYRDFELLVVGDACTDDSAEVVSGMGDPRVRWINLPRNFGQAAGPNNEGIRQAQGRIIAYLGHDDLWLPRHLELLVPAIDGGADLAYALTAMVPWPGAAPFAIPQPAFPYRPGMWITTSSVVHRRQALEGVGGWRHYRELRIDPEADLWQRLHAAKRQIRFVPRVTSVKFPAAQRRDVYRRRPFHEQAAWLERIRTEPNLEVTLLGQMLAQAQAEAQEPIRLRLRIGMRVWRWRLWSLLFGRGLHVIERRRKYKGLPARPD